MSQSSEIWNKVKRCRKCDEHFPISCFYPDRLGRHWVASTCKKCANKKNAYKPTGEGKLFEQIKIERSFLAEYEWRMESCNRLRDFDPDTWKEIPGGKVVPIRFVDRWNCAHIVAKWQDESQRLNPDNIELVSKRWHFREHHWQVLRTPCRN